MRRSILILSLATIVTMLQASNPSRYKDDAPKYGFTMNGYYFGSGLGASLATNLHVQKGYMGLQIGPVYHIQNFTLSGINFRYFYFLPDFKKNVKKSFKQGATFAPFLFYLMDYQDSHIQIPEVVYSDADVKDIKMVSTKVATFDHYVGIGIKADYRKGFFWDVSAGFGGYISSHKESLVPKTLGIHKDTYGFNACFQVGVGYKINL